MADPIAALASPRRREILRLVWDSERSAGEIASAFDVTWPAISQNLRLLKESGLLTQRRQGTRRLYRADRQALEPLAPYLLRMWGSRLDRLSALAESEDRSPSTS